MNMRLSLVFFVSVAVWGQNPAATDSANPTTAPAAKADSASVEALASANALMKDGKYEDAAAAFKAVIAKDPTSAEGQAGLMRSLLRARELDQADEAAKQAIVAAPQSAVVQAAFGDVGFRTGHFDNAEHGYRTALQLDPNSARGWFGMARMYDMVSMHRKARMAFAKAHELDPTDPQIEEYWFDSRPYPEQLEFLKKQEHLSVLQKEHITFLEAAIQKKPWELVGEPKPTEIKLPPYGREETWIDKGSQIGVRPVAKGFGLSVKFNDRATATLLLDTGAGGIIIGNKLAEKAGVVKFANSYFGGVGDKGPVQGYVGWVDKITIGSVEFRDCIVRVSSKNDIVDEAGLIGADVFDKFLITLDFREQKLLLSPLPKNPNPGEEEGVQDRYIAPEMQTYTKIWRFGHFLVVPTVVSDKVMGNFIVDTGASITTITPRLADQITKVTFQGGMIKGVSGTVSRVLTGDKAVLQFGGMRVRTDDIPVFDHHFNSMGTEAAGLISIRTLVQTKMTIDYRDGLVSWTVYEFKKARE
jgi:Tfp pilus assembly protein PilF/predicted aspartyl protease